MIIKAMLELIKYLADKGNLLCIGYAVVYLIFSCGVHKRSHSNSVALREH